MKTYTQEQVKEVIERSFSYGIDFGRLYTDHFIKMSDEFQKIKGDSINTILEEVEIKRVEKEKPMNKRKYWEENYSEEYTWELFDESWYWCSNCKSYTPEINCICYAR